jgi:hypothetical protein
MMCSRGTERHSFGNSVIVGREKLKLIFEKKQKVEKWNRFKWLRIGSGGGLI